ncbi:MAG: chromosome partitioning protein ParB [Polycyclovorans sp.]|mgnify:CR=1 FL=1|uniref:Chromosome-partitioning protein ParB n=1 Tax=Roseovarius halotolerans TaxID=505353 RepID=A0A1X6Z3E6_9RHOB|nr:ParB/RepB/Spo0J family partition protein [Roseovarius halotolerans]MAY26681.1 chromosome partitioning protein ParB [Polycyclovorans sp.]RKT32293.1 ParB family chromosome partitioning protein [Roseovarius halotolerans]SLN39149.1 Chromosome-partitioning protein ParB [Roseovarius halotolerans]
MADKKTRQRGLGRGLSALMADVNDDTATTGDAPKPADRSVPIEKINPNPDQPRRSFDKAQLEDLANSIKEKGIIQPLIVRPAPGKPGSFEIVAGERRWRAAQIAKLHEIPVLVREFNDTEVLEVAIIENIQRADLNPVEEAAGYSQLMEKFGHTQEKLSDVLGKSRSHIANCVRLLTLPDEVQTYLRDGKLSSGHARALITADDPAALAREVIKKGLSVRETEKLAKKPVGNIFSDGSKARQRPNPEKDADTKALEGDLSANLGMKVALNHKPGQEKGQITISYESLDELDTLCRILSVSNPA